MWKTFIVVLMASLWSLPAFAEETTGGPIAGAVKNGQMIEGKIVVPQFKLNRPAQLQAQPRLQIQPTTDFAPLRNTHNACNTAPLCENSYASCASGYRCVGYQQSPQGNTAFQCNRESACSASEAICEFGSAITLGPLDEGDSGYRCEIAG